MFKPLEIDLFNIIYLKNLFLNDYLRLFVDFAVVANFTVDVALLNIQMPRLI